METRIDRSTVRVPEQSSAPPPPPPPPRKKEGGFFSFGWLRSIKEFFFGAPVPRTIGEKLAAFDTPVVLPSGSGFDVVSAAEGLALPTQRAAPPDERTLRELAGADRATVILARESEPYALLLPPGYDPNGRNEVRVLSTPPGVPLAEAACTLAAGLPEAPGVVFVLAEERDPARLARLAEGEILPALEASYGLDFSRYGVGAASGAQWASELPQARVARQRLVAPLLSDGSGCWTQLLPTSDYKRQWPRTHEVSASERIPLELQKQDAERGAYFAPVIRSRALDQSARVGVYLPPGYDPSSAERYPVLFLLPGKGSPLSYWTSAGQLQPQLDQVMRGAATKMIVVIPDGTDNFFTNEGEKARHADFVTQDLVEYATQALKGDKSKLCISGISRGGHGALAIAASNPGLFRSVGCHSGALAEKSNAESAMHPLRLLQPLARQPRLLLDIGAQDKYFVEDNVQVAEALTALGGKVDLRIYDSAATKAEHNWNLWRDLLPDWVRFHQETFGRAGAGAGYGGSNVGPRRLEQAQEASRRSWAELAKRAQEGANQARAAVREIDRCRDLPGDIRAALPELADTVLADRKRELLRLAEQIGEQVPARPTAPYRESAAEGVKELEGKIRVLGLKIGAAAAEGGHWANVALPERGDLLAAAAAVPTIRASLLALTVAEPQLFRCEDAITGKRFSAQIAELASSKLLARAEEPGLAEFFDRLKERRYLWKFPGWSHSVCTCFTTWMKHPSLVLDLVLAAKKREPYPLPHLWDGDGPDALSPHPDLVDAFLPLAGKDGPRSERMDREQLRGSPLALERGLLLTVVDEIGKRISYLPADRPAKRCDPVAIALSRLTGQDVRYCYAYKLQTTDDLRKALRSQGELGLAFADVGLRVEGRFIKSHFPVFYDYDPRTDTVSWQDFSRPGQRIALSRFELDTDGDPNLRPAMFFRMKPELRPFLTPEEQHKKPASPVDLRWNERAGLDESE